MTDEPGTGDDVSVPLDAIPDPTLRFEYRNDEQVVTHANSTFESQFGPLTGDPTVAECLGPDGVGLDDEAVRSVHSSLAADDRVDKTVAVSEDRTIRIRSDPAATDVDDGGLVTVSRTPGRPQFGSEAIASIVSHDLRNPLDVATAHLRAARERGDEEHFDRVGEAHDRMERIIRDVLTLARGDESITPSESVALETVVRDAWSTVDTDDAMLTLDGDLPTVEADPSRLQRLFENLFRNSVEHGSRSDRARSAGVAHGTTDGQQAGDDESPTEAGTGETGEPTPLTVRVGPTSEGGFYVADDGVGIPESDHERVFEPGYSSSDTGAGLGLTIVERIAEGHDWRVTVPAAASEGARFEFHPAEHDQ